jgi:ribosomal protein S25
MGKVLVSAKGNEFSIVIPQGLAVELGLNPNASFELVKAAKGVWVLVELQETKAAAQPMPLAPAAAPVKSNPLDERIFYMLKELKLEDKVEGKFEARLGKAELSRFKELLKDGAIVPFKLTPQYKKAVYKTREEVEGAGANGTEKEGAKKESESPLAKEKPIEDYSLERDGLIVCKNEDRAKMLSNQFKKEIEEGRIRGLKDFSGLFYIIEDRLYQKYRLGVLAAVRSAKTVSLQDIAAKAQVSQLLARIACEFLKEEGEIIEKRKEQFQAVA